MNAAEVIFSEKQNPFEMHDLAMRTARNLKSEYLNLFEILLVIEAEKIYFAFEVPSFYLYCVELLELSPQIAKDFAVVVRKALEVPQLADAIRSQGLTLSKARKICPVLNEENSQEWIDLAVHCSCREIEKTVALESPKSSVYESMKYISGEVLEFKIGVSSEWAELLEKTKDLLSQKEKRAVSSEEALFVLMTNFCKIHDPVEKAKRAQANEKLYSPDDRRVPQTKLTRHRPMAIEHEVNLRDQNQCTYVDQKGQRCQSKRWLEKHHVVEFAQGGRHTPENLTTLCGAHHKITHRRSLDQKGPQRVT